LRIGVNALQLTTRNSGVGQYIYNMVSSLFSISTDQFFLYLSQGNTRPEWMAWHNLKVKEIPFRKEQAILRNIYELFCYGLDLRKDDLNIFWSPDTKLPLLTPNIPIVITSHDLAIYREPGTYQSSRVLYWRKLFERAVQKATCVVAISNATRDDLIEIMHVPSQKIRVIYCGVNSSFRLINDADLLKQVRMKYGLPENFLLFVGLFSPRKNIAGILKSFAILKNKFKIPHHLVMVGEKGWRYKSDLELVNSMGLGKSVFFPGFVEEEDLPAVYNIADVFVFPSIYEGFGLPVLEAMACGTPVVTSNVSSLPEVAGQAGILINPNNHEEIASEVYRVLSDKKVSSQLTKAGLERARHFTWENAAGELLKVFRELR
jgi:glycosyltransferase involved in cell wall biosynthesis